MRFSCEGSSAPGTQFHFGTGYVQGYYVFALTVSARRLPFLYGSDAGAETHEPDNCGVNQKTFHNEFLQNK